MQRAEIRYVSTNWRPLLVSLTAHTKGCRPSLVHHIVVSSAWGLVPHDATAVACPTSCLHASILGLHACAPA